MKHALKNSMTENMHGLLRIDVRPICQPAAVKLPGQDHRNADVFTSGVKEFARLGYIELVDARTGIPTGFRRFLSRP